jgi:hypothetical protein
MALTDTHKKVHSWMTLLSFLFFLDSSPSPVIEQTIFIMRIWDPESKSYQLAWQFPRDKFFGGSFLAHALFCLLFCLVIGNHAHATRIASSR